MQSDDTADHLGHDQNEYQLWLSGLADGMPGLVIILDRDWRFEYMNKEAEVLFKCSKDSLGGQKYVDIYPRQHGILFNPDWMRKMLSKGGGQRDIYSIQLHKWFDVRVYTRDGHIYILLKDITLDIYQKKIMRMMQLSVNKMGDMAFWFTPGGHIIYANQSACETLGYDEKKLVSMKLQDISSIHSLEQWTGHFKQAKGQGSVTFESSLFVSDGSAIPVEVNCNFVKYYNDEYIVAYARDITMRRNADEKLNASKAEAELYVDLMGHDINNMNQIALGFIELVQEKIGNGESLHREDAVLLGRAIGSLNNSSKLIDNVRKIQREKLGLYKLELIDVCKMLIEVIGQFKKSDDRDIAINYECPEGLFVPANELLREVFTNLIGNSVKHSGGPLTINVKAEKVGKNGEGFCRVIVEDNGPGIPDSLKRTLFDRLSLTTTRVRGKGFGLCLIKILVDDYNGHFSVEDRVSGDHTKGAKFVVTLPMAKN